MATAASQSEGEKKPLSKLPPRLKPERDEVTPENQKKVDAFYAKEWKEMFQKPGFPSFFKELDEDGQKIQCYKLMVARKYDPEAAKGMIVDVMQKCKDFKTEDRAYFPPAIHLKGYDIPALAAFFKQGVRSPTEQVDKIFEAMRYAYNPCIHKWSKWGHPVLYECYGRSNPELLVKKAKQLTPVGQKFTDVSALFHCFQNETALRLTRYQDETFAKPRGERVLGLVVVVDVEGLGMAHLGSENLAMVQTMFDMDKKYYAEFLSHVLVVNCPGLIRLAYSLVSPFIDARTRDKIEFYGPGDATEEALKKWILPENIPPIYPGGKCNCEGGCIVVPTEAEVSAAIAGKGDHLNENYTKTYNIKAGDSMGRVYKLAEGDVVKYALEVHEYDLNFGATFEPDDEKQPKTPIRPHSKTEKTLVSGEFTSPTSGQVRFVFDNKSSWLRSKTVQFKSEITEATPASPATASATSASL